MDVCGLTSSELNDTRGPMVNLFDPDHGIRWISTDCVTPSSIKTVREPGEEEAQMFATYLKGQACFSFQVGCICRSPCTSTGEGVLRETP